MELAVNVFLADEGYLYVHQAIVTVNRLRQTTEANHSDACVGYGQKGKIKRRRIAGTASSLMSIFLAKESRESAFISKKTLHMT